MKTQLGRFKLLEQLHPGGYTIVWTAEEDMGRGITRPAAVKILQGWHLENEEEVQQLNKEVNILIEMSSNANIVSIRHFDIDEEVGPYIAMELLGPSVYREIGDRPADPAHVRNVLSDIANGLKAMHSLDPTVVHRDIKPNNILPDATGLYKIADFGIASRFDEGDTLTRVTVKYAAPELLDDSIGKVCPASDLYALGMTVYELALGHELFRKQFPSIYDPHASADEKLADDRPKWMYWHCSLGQHVAPIKDVVEGFPEELSDLIEQMMRKPLDERVSSADEVLDRLSKLTTVRKSFTPASARAQATRQKSESKPVNPLILVGGAVAALFAVLAIGLLALAGPGDPEITLRFDNAENRLVTTETGTVRVEGMVDNLPEGGSVRVFVAGTNRAAVIEDTSSGRFSAEIPISSVGRDEDASVVVYDSAGQERLAVLEFKAERAEPETVAMSVVTEPSVRGAEVRIIPAAGGQPIINQTDSSGVARLTAVPYGLVDVVVEHPRYEDREQTNIQTDADGRTSIRVGMQEASQRVLDRRRQQLLEEIDDVAARAAAGDPEAIARLAELRQELAVLGDDSINADTRSEILAEMAELAEAAANGDPEAQRRLNELRRELAALDDEGALADRRREILDEMASLAEAAANGDPKAAARLRELQQELARIDNADRSGASGGPRQRIADERARIAAEMASLAEAAANGDPEAIAKMNALRERLAALDAEEAVLAAGGANAEERAAIARAEALAASRERLIGRLRERLQGEQGSGSTAGLDSIETIVRELEALEPANDDADGIMAELVRFRRSLLGELIDTVNRGRLGERYAVPIMKGLQIQLSDLVLEERALINGRDRLGLTLMDQRRGVLMSEILQHLTGLADGNSGAQEPYVTATREFEALGEDDTPNAQRRSQLMREAEQIAPQAVVGDTIAQTRMRQIRDELGTIEQQEAVRRAEIARSRSAGGGRFAGVSRGQGGAGGVGGTAGGGRGGAGGGLASGGRGGGGSAAAIDPNASYFEGSASELVALLPNLENIDRTVLLRLPQNQFLAYIEKNIPLKSLQITNIAELKKARLSGRVFSQEEYDRLMRRIDTALVRLEPEVAIDTPGLSNDVREALERAGAEHVRVRAAVFNGRERMYVRFDRAGNVDSDTKARAIVEGYVLDSQLIDLQGFEKQASRDDD